MWNKWRRITRPTNRHARTLIWAFKCHSRSGWRFFASISLRLGVEEVSKPSVLSTRATSGDDAAAEGNAGSDFAMGMRVLLDAMTRGAPVDAPQAQPERRDRRRTERAAQQRPCNALGLGALDKRTNGAHSLCRW